MKPRPIELSALRMVREALEGLTWVIARPRSSLPESPHFARLEKAAGDLRDALSSIEREAGEEIDRP
jgi:hypothetical protein